MGYGKIKEERRKNISRILVDGLKREKRRRKSANKIKIVLQLILMNTSILVIDTSIYE